MEDLGRFSFGQAFLDEFLEDELRLRGEPLGAVVALEDREGVVDGCDVEFVDQGADASRSTSERAALAFIAIMYSADADPTEIPGEENGLSGCFRGSCAVFAAG